MDKRRTPETWDAFRLQNGTSQFAIKRNTFKFGLPSSVKKSATSRIVSFDIALLIGFPENPEFKSSLLPFESLSHRFTIWRYKTYRCTIVNSPHWQNGSRITSKGLKKFEVEWGNLLQQSLVDGLGISQLRQFPDIESSFRTYVSIAHHFKNILIDL